MSTEVCVVFGKPARSTLSGTMSGYNFSLFVATWLLHSRVLQVRVAHDVDGVVVPLVGRYRCKNPACDLVKQSARSRAQVEEREGGPKVSEIEWNAAAVRSRCKEGVTFNTMDDRREDCTRFTWASKTSSCVQDSLSICKRHRREWNFSLTYFFRSLLGSLDRYMEVLTEGIHPTAGSDRTRQML